MSLSGDFSTLVIGNTDGTISLLSTETFNVIKTWEALHDLPVMCLAARPLPLPLELPGEDGMGIQVDAISASANNKMALITRQQRSSLKQEER